MDKKQFFTTTLLDWSEAQERPMPWKGEKNPYYIWLSEIILQQTRVEQGWAYYLKFKENYPQVEDLAKAPEDEVMKLWEGLGYYSRARNLHAAAKYIVADLAGVFPSTYEEILKLKGVGPYTAAAISAFAYGLPQAVLDGNVYRVLSRIFGIETPIDSSQGKKEFQQLADALLYRKDSGKYNQAIMDFGATQCKPKQALCESCPMANQCVAKNQQKVGLLPIKSKRIKKRTRYFYYLRLRFKNKSYIIKRRRKDIWQNLYEFPMIENSEAIDYEEVFNQKDFQERFPERGNWTLIGSSKSYKQTLTHQKIFAVFMEIQLSSPLISASNEIQEVNESELNNFAFPKIIDCYLKDNSLFLKLF